MKLKFLKILPIFAALAVVFGIYTTFGIGDAAADGDDKTVYTVEHMQIDGARDSEQAVVDATQTKGNHYNEIYKAVLLDGTTHTWSQISTALGVDSGSRVIDETDTDNKRVLNFHSGKNTYLVVKKQDNAITYNLKHVQIDSAGDSSQAVLDATQTEKILSLNRDATIHGTSHTWSQISAALDVGGGSRVIDETDTDNKRVINHVNGRNTYLVVTVKSTLTSGVFVVVTPTVTPPTATPVPINTYTVTYVKVSDDSTAAAVKTSTKTAATSPTVSFNVVGASTLTDAEILNSVDDSSLYTNIDGQKRYIGRDDEVHNFAAGKNDYWLVENGSTTTVADASIDDATYSRTHVALYCPSVCIQAKSIERHGVAIEDDASKYMFTTVKAPHYYARLQSLLTPFGSNLIDFTSGSFDVRSFEGYPTPTTWAYLLETGAGVYHVANGSESVTYVKEHMQIDGARDSKQAVLDANQTNGRHYDAIYDEVTLVGASHTWVQISTALGLKGSRVIDETDVNDKSVLQFKAGKGTYIVVTIKDDDTVVVDPPIVTNSVTYIKELMNVGGTNDSEQAILDGALTPASQYHVYYREATLSGTSHTYNEIATALEVGPYAKVIDATDMDNRNVVNFRETSLYYVLSVK